MEQKKIKVQVKIGGYEYTLVGVESEEHMHAVALYIDKKIQEVTRANNRLSTSMAAVLAAVNVADDCLRTKKREEALKIEIQNVSDEVEELKEQLARLSNEKANLEKRNTSLQVELARREAELGEVRNAFEKNIRQKMYLA